MFKHLLLPTDGSKLAERAVTHGLKMAQALGARITLVTVVPEFQMVADESFAVPMSGQFKQRYEKEAKARAEKMLATLKIRADKAGIRSESLVVLGDLPYKQIIDSARKRKCDLIVMASHGRRGLAGLLLGSETVKVLTHGKIPVLVVR